LVHHLLELDERALIWINSHHNALLDSVLTPIAYAGEYGAIWAAVLLLMLIFGKPLHRRTALLLIITVIIVDRVIAAGLGHFFVRTRPYLALDGIRQMGIRWTSSSFPSGHAHSVWIAAIILGSCWKRTMVPLVTFAVLSCYSRPYFGMHYPLDVIVGSVIGIFGGFAAVSIDRWLQSRGAAKRGV
jgi:membrane-associated phospholipid phosphatase